MSGSSTNGVVTLGALQYLYDNELVNASTYVATSSGSIIATLLSIGYTPLELLCKICVGQLYKNITNFNVTNMLLLGKGLMNFQQIEDSLQMLMIEKIGFVPTLNEIYERFGKRIVYATCNATDGIREYISKDEYPHLSCLTAIRMSSSFPFVFLPCEYEGKKYIDGGIVDNYPVEYASNKIGGKIIGICITTSKPVNFETNFHLFKSLVHVHSRIIMNDVVPRTQNVMHILIEHDSGFFSFDSTNKQVLSLFDKGYKECKKLLNEL